MTNIIETNVKAFKTILFIFYEYNEILYGFLNIMKKNHITFTHADVQFIDCPVLDAIIPFFFHYLYSAVVFRGLKRLFFANNRRNEHNIHTHEEIYVGQVFLHHFSQQMVQTTNSYRISPFKLNSKPIRLFRLSFIFFSLFFLFICFSSFALLHVLFSFSLLLP